MAEMEFAIATKSSPLIKFAAAVEVRGEIDVFTSSQLRAALHQVIDDGAKAVVLDLERVRYLDSAGIGVLVSALKRSQRSGARFILAGLNRQIERIFEITGLLRIFEIYPSEQAAFQELGAHD